MRALDIIDIGEPEPERYLPLDPPQHTVALLEHGFAAQLRRKGVPATQAQTLSRMAAYEMFLRGWRTSESILHRCDEPIPAPQPPRLPPLRIAA